PLEEQGADAPSTDDVDEPGLDTRLGHAIPGARGVGNVGIVGVAGTELVEDGRLEEERTGAPPGVDPDGVSVLDLPGPRGPARVLACEEDGDAGYRSGGQPATGRGVAIRLEKAVQGLEVQPLDRHELD